MSEKEQKFHSEAHSTEMNQAKRKLDLYTPEIQIVLFFANNWNATRLPKRNSHS